MTWYRDCHDGLSKSECVCGGLRAKPRAHTHTKFTPRRNVQGEPVWFWVFHVVAELWDLRDPQSCPVHLGHMGCWCVMHAGWRWLLGLWFIASYKTKCGCYLRECFIYDWNNWNINKMLKLFETCRRIIFKKPYPIYILLHKRSIPNSTSTQSNSSN